ncbi:3-dehydroquinate synthase [Ornithinimicrobium sp. Arc0846-15]|nr:3-dehydroquinate synthase [Ornithinimicrobium laminariae]
MTDIRTVDVGDEYQVFMGVGAMGRLADFVRPGRRVLVIQQQGRDELAHQATDVIEAAGGQPHLAVVPDAEAAKTVSVLAQLWSQMGQAAFTRDDLVVGLGGGATTDLAGFAAASWLRGVDLVQIPTSMLGIVDAAVGGKTGINTPEGKNLVGAFYPPQGVLCDPAWMTTQSQADYVAGLAEVIKAGFIADPVILELIEADFAAAVDPSAEVAVELMARAVQVKATVVAADLKESNLREILNYGHTFAHAIELSENYTWRHGDAVAVGMIFAAELGLALGRTSAEIVQRLRTILTKVGLPTVYRDGDWDELRTAMARDKKSRGNMLRFVVLDDLAKPARAQGPSEDDLLHAYKTVS